jgi:hypothetical protein
MSSVHTPSLKRLLRALASLAVSRAPRSTPSGHRWRSTNWCIRLGFQRHTQESGQIPLPFESIYSATKFAVEGLVASLRYEVEPFGIQVALARRSLGGVAGFARQCVASSSAPLDTAPEKTGPTRGDREMCCSRNEVPDRPE